MRASIVVASFIGLAAAGGKYGRKGKHLTTSTIYTTEIKTVTSCEPQITECKGKWGNHGPVYVTETIPLTTTVCEVDDEETSTYETPMPTYTSTTSYYHKKPKVTKTLYTTEVHTVTDCPETVTECPHKGGKYTVTETIPVTTTVCDEDEEPVWTYTHTEDCDETTTAKPVYTKVPCYEDKCGDVYTHTYTKEPCHGDKCGHYETSTYYHPKPTIGTTYVPAPVKTASPVIAGAGRVEGGLIAAAVGLAAALL